MDKSAMVEVFLRFGHVFSGIVWVGHLYFFNFVNVPFQGKMDAETKKKVNPELMPRALWWFRWSAMSTLIFGLALFFWLYMGKNMGGGSFMRELDIETGKEALSGRALYIMIGMTVAIIMWFNVWFIIWPAQKLIIGGLKSGNPAPAHLPKRALFTSRFNTFASGPMLFLMFLAPHGGKFDISMLIMASVVGLLVPFLCIKASKNVGTSI